MSHSDRAATGKKRSALSAEDEAELAAQQFEDELLQEALDCGEDVLADKRRAKRTTVDCDSDADADVEADADSDVDSESLEEQQAAVPSTPTAPIEELVSVLNMVFTARLGFRSSPDKPVKLNIRDLLVRLKNYGFRKNPRRSSSAIMRSQQPSCSVLIFEEGKIVCPGTCNVQDARVAIEFVVRLVRDCRPAYSTLYVKSLRVQNIVGTVGYPNFIDVTQLHTNEPNVAYNPLSHGAILNVYVDVMRNNAIVKTKIAVLIYRSGYVVITGAKRTSILALALASAMKTIRKYFFGSAERSFSLDQTRRYCTSSLKPAIRAYRASPDAPAPSTTSMYCTVHRSASELIAVRKDGTVGTLREWYEQCAPVRLLRSLLVKLGDIEQLDEFPDDTPSARVVQQVTEKTPITSNMLTVYASSPAAKQLTECISSASSLVVARTDTQLAVFNERGALRTNVVRKLTGRKLAERTLQRQAEAVAVMQHGAKAVRAEQRPKHTKQLEPHVAEDLYSGF